MANISPLFALLTLVLVLAVLVSLVLVRFRQSLLVGYLMCGVLIGNFGLLWLTGMDKGRSGDLPLRRDRGGAADVYAGHRVSLTEFGTCGARPCRRRPASGRHRRVSPGCWRRRSGFPRRTHRVGVAVALSSTAVAMKSFQDLGQQNNPGARASLGIALFQDVLVIVFFLVMPASIAEGEGAVALADRRGAVEGRGFSGRCMAVGRYGITPLLHVVARTRSRELFTLTVIGLCAGVAFAGGAFNLSLALGAFAAGLVVSESIYSHRILSDILPFKDLFLAIFFISVGLLIDLSVVAAEWPRVLLGSVVILVLKGGIVFGVLKWFKLPGRPALLAAGSLAEHG